MINYNLKEFLARNYNEEITCNCSYCNTSFKRVKSQLVRNLKDCQEDVFCSRECLAQSLLKSQIVECSNCYSKVEKSLAEIKRSKAGRFFCNSSCAATYNNTNKTHGTRRSKMEAHLESVITDSYPSMKMLCNDKTAIGSELDFYFPELKFAIELNGIFHYEPIYGQDKLNKIQNNDNRKIIACYEKGIELAIIDSSSVQRMSSKTKEKYGGIVKVLIDTVLSNRQTVS